MKPRLTLLASATLIIVGCASKPNTAVTQKPVETKPLETKTISTADAIVEGRNLYDNNCAKCHKLFAPTDFSKADWKPILKSMQKKAHLADADMANIETYLFSEIK